MKESDSTKSFALPTSDAILAEVLFAHPNVKAKEAFNILNSCRQGSADLRQSILCKLQDSLQLTVKHYREVSERRDEDYETLNKQILHKVEEWSRKIGKLSIKELLKINDYFGISVTEIPGIEIKGPLVIEEMLNAYIISQPAYVRSLAVAAYIHFLKTRNESAVSLALPKSVILAAGQTGVGKTLGFQVLSRFFDLYFEVIHANTLVAQGILGNQISDAFTNIYLRTKSLKKISKACILVDEFDKLLNTGGYYDRSVLNELLSMVDDKGEIAFRVSHDRYAETVRVSTKEVLFVFTGVFEGLEAAVTKRLNPDKQKLGFMRTKPKPESGSACFYKEATEEDYLSIGVKPELMSRITSLTYLRSLNAHDLSLILTHSAESPLIPFRNYFLLHSCELILRSNGAMAIAEYAAKNQLGARGLKTVLTRVLADQMLVPERAGNKLVIDARFVKSKL